MTFPGTTRPPVIDGVRQVVVITADDSILIAGVSMLGENIVAVQWSGDLLTEEQGARASEMFAGILVGMGLAGMRKVFYQQLPGWGKA